YTTKLAKGLNIIGLINIQFVLSKGEVFVLEVNPRASRTVPFLSKITDIPMAKLATKAITNISLKEQGYENGLVPYKEGVYVKAPVFSFSKLKNVDITLGPEMKSTGEVMGKDDTLNKALYKSIVASGLDVKDHGTALFTIADKDKEEAVGLAKRFSQCGYRILSTSGTAEALKKEGIPVVIVDKIGEDGSTLLRSIQNGNVQIVVNMMTKGKEVARDGFRIRRESVENGVPCLTSLDTARTLIEVIESMKFNMNEM